MSAQFFRTYILDDLIDHLEVLAADQKYFVQQNCEIGVLFQYLAAAVIEGASCIHNYPHYLELTKIKAKSIFCIKIV